MPFSWKGVLDWSKANPEKVALGSLGLVGLLAIVQVLNVPKPKVVEHEQPIGRAPAGRSLSPEELAKQESPLAVQNQDVALNTLTENLTKARGNTIAVRCARWRKAYLDLEAPKGVTLRRFVASKINEQSELMLSLEPGDFSGQLLRQGEIEALRALWVDCKPMVFQVETPAGLDSARNRAGSVAVAAGRLELEAIKAEATSDDIRDAAAAAAAKATNASAVEEPILEPLGGTSQ